MTDGPEAEDCLVIPLPAGYRTGWRTGKPAYAMRAKLCGQRLAATLSWSAWARPASATHYLRFSGGLARDDICTYLLQLFVADGDLGRSASPRAAATVGGKLMPKPEHFRDVRGMS